MKYRSFVLLLLLLSSFTVKAQRFKGGILIGMNASQIEGDSYAGFYKGGLLAGAFVNTELRDKFGAQLEIKYSAKGSSTYKDDPNPLKIQLNYIDVPILGTYEAVENLKIEAGISFNYLFKAEYYQYTWYNEWYGDEPNSIETSLCLGINYAFFNRFDLNVRWNYSLFPVHSEYSGSDFGEGAWYNHVLNFGLYFHLGQR
jgi:hypothetical protein